MSSPDQFVKLQPLLVRAVAQALRAIFIEKRHADKVLEHTLRQNPKAGSRDRAFIAETTYETVRYYRLYVELLGKTPEIEPDFWQLAGIHFILNALQPNAFRLPDWKEYGGMKPKEILERHAVLRNTRKLRESIPDWMDELGERELPETWDVTLPWLNRPAQVVLRANRLKTDRAALQKALLQEGIAVQAVGPGDALVLLRRQNVFQSKAFKAGWFEVQDYSSQQVAALLAPEPGMRVVDACAGGGGKTLHLAALMQNRGALIALDTLTWKLDELRQRARRAGADNIETRPIDNRKAVKRLYGSADRLLLDVPCSGLGVLRRNPDSKWKLGPEQLDQLRATQQDILQYYSPITKPGGRMVYATCSILPSENQLQVETFLKSEAGKDFGLLEEQRILPQDAGFDGFYIALLARE
jgi:16S rRNA (cytosine967-C5)-methyltransferase